MQFAVSCAPGGAEAAASPAPAPTPAVPAPQENAAPPAPAPKSAMPAPPSPPEKAGADGEGRASGGVRLAITAAELLVEGVPKRRLEPTLAQLRRAVEREPALNTYPVLAGLARQMQRFL